MKRILVVLMMLAVNPLFGSAEDDLVALARMSNGTFESEERFLAEVIRIKESTSRVRLPNHIEGLTPLYRSKRAELMDILREMYGDIAVFEKRIDSKWHDRNVNPDTLVSFYIYVENMRIRRFDRAELLTNDYLLDERHKPEWSSTASDWRLVWPCEKGLFHPKTIAQALKQGIHLVAAPSTQSQRVHGMDYIALSMMKHDLDHGASDSSTRAVLAEVIKIAEADGDDDAIRKAEAFMLLAVHEQSYNAGYGTYAEALGWTLRSPFESLIANYSAERKQEFLDCAKQCWQERFEQLSPEDVVTIHLGDPLPGAFEKSIVLRSGDFRHTLSKQDIFDASGFLTLSANLMHLWGGGEDQYCQILNYAGFECDTDEYFATFDWLNKGIVELTNCMMPYIDRLPRTQMPW